MSSYCTVHAYTTPFYYLKPNLRHRLMECLALDVRNLELQLRRLATPIRACKRSQHTDGPVLTSLPYMPRPSLRATLVWLGRDTLVPLLETRITRSYRPARGISGFIPRDARAV